MKHILITTIAAVLLVGCGHTSFKIGHPSPQSREEILDLISKYSYFWDNRSAEKWADLFLDNATWGHYLDGVFAKSFGSRNERLSFANEKHKSFTELGIQTRHHQTNTLLKRNPDGSIRGDTIFSVIWQHAEESAPKLIHSGIYRDIFVKTPNGWKFKSREIHVDHK